MLAQKDELEAHLFSAVGEQGRSAIVVGHRNILHLSLIDRQDYAPIGFEWVLEGVLVDADSEASFAFGNELRDELPTLKPQSGSEARFRSGVRGHPRSLLPGAVPALLGQAALKQCGEDSSRR